MKVEVSATAQWELKQIWNYNAEHPGVRQADIWDDFVKAKIQSLEVNYSEGRSVKFFPSLKYVVAKRAPSDDGDYVIYMVDELANVVNVLHVFHTKQDVQARLGKDHL